MTALTILVSGVGYTGIGDGRGAGLERSDEAGTRGRAQPVPTIPFHVSGPWTLVSLCDRVRGPPVLRVQVCPTQWRRPCLTRSRERKRTRDGKRDTEICRQQKIPVVSVI